MVLLVVVILFCFFLSFRCGSMSFSISMKERKKSRRNFFLYWWFKSDFADLRISNGCVSQKILFVNCDYSQPSQHQRMSNKMKCWNYNSHSKHKYTHVHTDNPNGHREYRQSCATYTLRKTTQTSAHTTTALWVECRSELRLRHARRSFEYSELSKNRNENKSWARNGLSFKKKLRGRCFRWPNEWMTVTANS